MKREKIYCLVGALIITILLFFLTLKFTSLCDGNVFVILLPYFGTTLAVLVSILDFIKQKSKVNQFAVLTAIDAWLCILCFIFALGTAIITIKTILYAIFAITFIMLPLLGGYWSKYEKSKK